MRSDARILVTGCKKKGDIESFGDNGDRFAGCFIGNGRTQGHEQNGGDGGRPVRSVVISLYGCSCIACRSLAR